VVDSVFAFRPEYNDLWDYRIWLEVDAEVSLQRGITRDSNAEAAEEAMRLHRDRYRAAAEIYIAEVGPLSVADTVVRNDNFASPAVLSRRLSQASRDARSDRQLRGSGMAADDEGRGAE
jgi:uridine kinase